MEISINLEKVLINSSEKVEMHLVLASGVMCGSLSLQPAIPQRLDLSSFITHPKPSCTCKSPVKDKDASDDDHPSKITATVTLGKKEHYRKERYRDTEKSDTTGKERYRGLGVTVIPPPPAQPSAPKIKQPKFNRARQIAIMNPRKVRKVRILTGTFSGFFLET